MISRQQSAGIYFRDESYLRINIIESECYNMIPKDPAMLLSFVNLKLRDFYENLDVLCDDLEIDRDEVEQRLSLIDYHYDKEKNQFV